VSTITIHPMVEYASEVPRIAAWFFEEWRSLYGEETQASVRQRIEGWLTKNQIPTALVAVSEGQVVGTVVLKDRELQQFSFSPWLAGLFVAPEFRRKGIGALLVRAAESVASSLGVQRLYLYTPASQGHYEHLGWSLIEYCQLPSGSVAIMGKALQPTSSDDAYPPLSCK
jgi:predicted N-acetyltransferase YhbS